MYFQNVFYVLLLAFRKEILESMCMVHIFVVAMAGVCVRHGTWLIVCAGGGGHGRNSNQKINCQMHTIQITWQQPSQTNFVTRQLEEQCSGIWTKYETNLMPAFSDKTTTPCQIKLANGYLLFSYSSNTFYHNGIIHNSTDHNIMRAYNFLSLHMLILSRVMLIVWPK